jgi:hypothetical protein
LRENHDVMMFTLFYAREHQRGVMRQNVFQFSSLMRPHDIFTLKRRKKRKASILQRHDGQKHVRRRRTRPSGGK